MIIVCLSKLFHFFMNFVSHITKSVCEEHKRKPEACVV